jgi:hypothetical protein
MNYLSKLTDLEKVNLTNEEKEALILRLACSEGYKGLKKPEEIVIEEPPEVQVFGCAEIYSTDVNAIREIQSLISKGDFMQISYQHGVVCLEPLSERRKKIVSEEYPLEESVNPKDNTKKANRRILLKEYCNDQLIYKEASETILRDVQEAEERVAIKEEKARVWQMYLEIAKGDPDIAKAFWDKAFPYTDPEGDL